MASGRGGHSPEARSPLVEKHVCEDCPEDKRVSSRRSRAPAAPGWRCVYPSTPGGLAGAPSAQGGSDGLKGTVAAAGTAAEVDVSLGVEAGRRPLRAGARAHPPQQASRLEKRLLFDLGRGPGALRRGVLDSLQQPPGLATPLGPGSGPWTPAACTRSPAPDRHVPSELRNTSISSTRDTRSDWERPRSSPSRPLVARSPPTRVRGTRSRSRAPRAP